MTTLQGQRIPPETRATELLPVIEARRRPDFLLLVKPQLFKWDTGADEYLPDLMQLKISPGVQGVADNGDVSVAIAHHERKGRARIRNGDASMCIPGDPNPALAVGEYQIRWPARTRPGHRGYAYGWAWERYEISPLQKGVVWRQDTEAKRRFQRRLLASGLLPPMKNTTRQAMLKIAEARVTRLEDLDSGRTGVRRRMRKARATLDALYDDLERHDGTVFNRLVFDDDLEPAKPKRKRRTKAEMAEAAQETA